MAAVVIVALAAVVTAATVARAQKFDWNPLRGDRIVTATAPAGTFRGIENDEFRYRLWAGIPYVQPVNGFNRWGYPKRTEPMTSPFNATKFGASCPQDCQLPIGFCPDVIDEDCLFLDVWTPHGAAGRNGDVERNERLASDEVKSAEHKYPVFFFIHGGAFNQGSGNTPAYYADFLASTKNVCVVSINYRLGALGWLGTVDGRIPSNLGLWDQRSAMGWVRENIAAFGCNATNVALVGESAGAMSIVQHLMWPGMTKTNAPFQKAIIQSAVLTLPYKDERQTDKYAVKLAKKLGCGGTDVACMRRASYGDIVKYQAHATPLIPKSLYEFVLDYTPIIDNHIVKDQPLHQLTNGGMKIDIPLIIGSNEDEGVMFVYRAFGYLPYTLYRTILLALFPSSGKLTDLYPSKLFADARPSMSLLIRDFLFRCPSYYVANKLHRTFENNIYMYNYNHSLSFKDAWPESFAFCRDKACHGAELILEFNAIRHEPKDFPPTPEERKLISVLSTAFTRFVATASPNIGVPVNGSAVWNPYGGASNMAFLEFNTDYAQAWQNMRWVSNARCDYWNEYFDNDWYATVVQAAFDEVMADRAAEAVDSVDGNE